MKKDYYSSIIEETFFELISEWRESGLSEKEISDKLNQENINQATRTLYEQASSDVLKFFVEKKFEISCKERIKSDKFIAHHNEIWGECFAVSETMYVMAVEAAEIYSKFVADTIPDEEKLDKQYTFLVLQYIHGRCCQEFLEILHLIKNGFADAAYARWRSMYELCCIACFIKNKAK